MGLYEQLSLSFPEEQTVFGTCLLIPTTAFKPEWESQLKAEGVKVFQQSYNGRMFFFLKKPNSNSQSDSQTPQAPPASQQQPKPMLKRFEWTPENFELVKRLRSEGLSLREISKRLSELGFKPPAHATIRRKLNEIEDASTLKPQNSNCEVDGGLFHELMQSAQLLYSHGLRKACSILLKQASNMLEQG